jgi:hypothetical protein
MVYGTNAPWGLKPVKRADGSPYTGQVNEYPIADGYATALYTGDPVMRLADGTIGIGTAGNACLGIFMGVKYQHTDGTFKHEAVWPAAGTTIGTTTAKALVADDPYLIMSVQEAATNTGVGTGTAGTALTLAEVGACYNFKAPTAGDSVTGTSAYFLDNASAATTATLNFILDGLDPNPDNVAAGTAYANWYVRWNQHQYKAGVAGITS